MGDDNAEHLKAGVRLKASTVTLSDGVKSDVQIGPVAVHVNRKEYMEGEVHLEVVFDIAEFQRSGTEKLMQAELVVVDGQLVDSDKATFVVAEALRERGLPLYVFEQVDMEQLIKEEKTEVVAAAEETRVAAEGEQQEATDTMTEKSELEAAVEEVAAPAEKKEEKVECLCVHGTCNEGQSTCRGCESGWTGTHCDVPSATPAMVNKNKKKDYTSADLRPKDDGPRQALGRRRRPPSLAPF